MWAASSHAGVRPEASPSAAATAESARYAASTVVAANLRPGLAASVVSITSNAVCPVSLDIAPVASSRDLRRFVDLPWQIYDPVEHPQWVPPLRIAVRDALDKKNPFYKEADRQLFLASRNGKVVGRVAAIENRGHNEFHQDRVGFFGFFECGEDQEAATELFGAAEKWLRGRQLDTMRGPMNPSTNHECGMLIDGFERHPMIMTTWNPRYYSALVETAGFIKAKDLLAYYFPMQGDQALRLPDRYRAHAERALSGKRLEFRNLDLKHFKQEVERCWEIYNSAWERNWGFFPMSRESFEHEAQVLRYIVNPDFAFMAEVNGEPAGFLVVVPDYHHAYKAIGNGRLLPFGLFKILAAKRTLRTVRVMILGAKPEYRRRGIFALFVHEMVRRAKPFGYLAGEGSWILEDNEKLNRPLLALGAKEYRRWRIYDRSIA